MIGRSRRWIVRVIEDRTIGTMNAPGPRARVTMKSVLDEYNRALGNKAQLTWVDAAFLEQHGVEGWRDMPMWIDNHGDFAGFGTLQSTRAVHAGLTFRPIGDTARDTLAWRDTQPGAKRAKARSSGI